MCPVRAILRQDTSFSFKIVDRKSAVRSEVDWMQGDDVDELQLELIVVEGRELRAQLHPDH